jgi:molybdopterin synthase sulfur carrier subunit
VSITVRYFASLKDRMGRAGDSLAPGEVQTVREVWERVAGGEPLPANTLLAVNLEYVDLAHPVRDGDEVAFFPPVTGG